MPFKVANVTTRVKQKLTIPVSEFWRISCVFVASSLPATKWRGSAHYDRNGETTDEGRDTCADHIVLRFSAARSRFGEQPKPAAKVTGSGCVEPGVEAGCKVLKDAKTGVSYNLFFSSKDQPAFDTAISFEGTSHDGPTTCMQGKAVDVSKWSKIRMHCPAAASEPKPKKD
jgi:hypothetical protein